MAGLGSTGSVLAVLCSSCQMVQTEKGLSRSLNWILAGKFETHRVWWKEKDVLSSIQIEYFWRQHLKNWTENPCGF